MSMKKLAVACVLVVSLVVGWYVVATSAPDRTAARAAPVEVVQLGSSTLDAQQAPAGVKERAPAASLAPDSTSTGTPGSALVFVVVRELGSAVANALVALVDADANVTASRTDAEGRCTLAASAGAGRVYVREEGAFPQHFVVDPLEGRHMLEVPRGSEFSGRLIMTGPEPMPRFELQLTTDSAPDGLAVASQDVFRALEMLRYDAPDLVARTTPAADGSFRFRVPDAKWSGTLKLPPELVFVDSAQPTRSSESVVERPVVGFEARIAYRPRIIGRLVDAANRAPVANAEFDCALHWSDGNDLLTGGRTGDDGRFTIALDYRTDATGFGIGRVRARGGRSASVPNSPTWSRPCEPFDAGDVECVFPPSRELVFRAVDPDGQPLAGARAEVRGLDVATADEHGVGRFNAVPLDAREMRIAAPSHAIVAMALTAETPSPLEVVLPPTNRLTIVLPPEARGREDLRVDLVSRALLFGGTTRMYDKNLRGGMIGSCFSADGDAGTREGAVTLGFDAEGRLEVEGIAPGVPFRIRVEWWSSRSGGAGDPLELAAEPLGATEQRRIDLVLDPRMARALRALHGRVIDEAGRPIHDAGVGNRIGDASIGTVSGLDGSFRLDMSDADTTDVEITKRGFLPYRERARDLTTDRALEATLRRGHDLRVELVDTEGRAIPGARVRAEIAGFGPPWRIENDRAGVHVLCDVPAGRADVEIELAGRTYARSHDGPGDVARFVLPAHGRIEVSWHIGEPPGSQRAFQIALRPLDVGVPPQVEWTPGTEPEEKHVFEAVLPGEYTVGLEVGTPSQGDVDTVYAPLREPRRITVRGGETLRLGL